MLGFYHDRVFYSGLYYHSSTFEYEAFLNLATYQEYSQRTQLKPSTENPQVYGNCGILDEYCVIILKYLLLSFRNG